MRYPVGDGSNENFKKYWYIADGFGTNRGTYFHSGADINLRTGGDSDLGEKIYAISSGKKKYYHFASHPNSGYGIHAVYQIEGPWGTRWVGMAHLLDNTPIKDKQDFPEGEWLAKIGKSGTTYAHLHLKIYKVDPGTIGIDTVAKTEQQLNEWFEDPILFIEKWIDYKPTQQEEGYTICLNGAVIAKYETNPDEKIKELNKTIQDRDLQLAGAGGAIGILEEKLGSQETDNVRLIEEKRKALRNYDDAVLTNRGIVIKNEGLIDDVDTLKAKLDALKSGDPLESYTHILRLFNKTILSK